MTLLTILQADSLASWYSCNMTLLQDDSFAFLPFLLFCISCIFWIFCKIFAFFAFLYFLHFFAFLYFCLLLRIDSYTAQGLGLIPALRCKGRTWTSGWRQEQSRTDFGTCKLWWMTRGLYLFTMGFSLFAYFGHILHFGNFLYFLHFVAFWDFGNFRKFGHFGQNNCTEDWHHGWWVVW